MINKTKAVTKAYDSIRFWLYLAAGRLFSLPVWTEDIFHSVPGKASRVCWSTEDKGMIIETSSLTPNSSLHYQHIFKLSTDDSDTESLVPFTVLIRIRIVTSALHDQVSVV